MQIGQGVVMEAELACQQTHVVIGDRVLWPPADDSEVERFRFDKTAGLMVFDSQQYGGFDIDFLLGIGS